MPQGDRGLLTRAISSCAPRLLAEYPGGLRDFGELQGVVSFAQDHQDRFFEKPWNAKVGAENSSVVIVPSSGGTDGADGHRRVQQVFPERASLLCPSRHAQVLR